MFILALYEILYNPSKKKMITNFLDTKDIMVGNGILWGLSGFMFIIGPIISGIIIELLGLDIIFLIISTLHIISTIIILFIKIKKHGKNKVKKYDYSIFKDTINGYKYFKSNLLIKELIIFNTVISATLASVNAAFYPFAFDILNINSKGWGLMMSVFYGTNLLAMIISIYFNKILYKKDMLFSYFFIIIISSLWFCYSLSEELVVVIGLQFLEGLLVSLLTIIINTKLQIITNRAFIARIISINDFLNNLGKIISIVLTYFFLQYKSPRSVFEINFIILAFYGTYKVIFLNKQR